MRLTTLDNTTPMQRLEIEEADWDKLDAFEAKRLATLVATARHFEECILRLDKLNLVHGPAHSSLGQEGGAAGRIRAPPFAHLIHGHTSASHQCLAKALNSLLCGEFDPA